jgi:3-oxoacyl-[acyl-carrier-protein] synthase III
MNAVKHSLRAHILESIGVPESHTYISIDKFGHWGPADCLFTLAKAHREG